MHTKNPVQAALLHGHAATHAADADALPPSPPSPLSAPSPPSMPPPLSPPSASCCRICLEPCTSPYERLGCACKSDAAHAECAARWFSVRASGGAATMRSATACEVCCSDAAALPPHVRRTVRLRALGAELQHMLARVVLAPEMAAYLQHQPPPAPPSSQRQQQHAALGGALAASGGSAADTQQQQNNHYHPQQQQQHQQLWLRAADATGSSSGGRRAGTAAAAAAAAAAARPHFEAAASGVRMLEEALVVAVFMVLPATMASTALVTYYACVLELPLRFSAAVAAAVGTVSALMWLRARRRRLALPAALQAHAALFATLAVTALLGVRHRDEHGKRAVVVAGAVLGTLLGGLLHAAVITPALEAALAGAARGRDGGGGSARVSAAALAAAQQARLAGDAV